MSTGFLTLQAALAAALAPALAGGAVSINRARPLPASQATGIALSLQQSTAQEVVLGMLDWVTSFSVECYARAATGADPAGAIDALLADVWARLCAIDSGALGAQAVTINPQLDWSVDEAETPVVCVTLRLSVQHRTPFATLIA